MAPPFIVLFADKVQQFGQKMPNSRFRHFTESNFQLDESLLIICSFFALKFSKFKFTIYFRFSVY